MEKKIFGNSEYSVSTEMCKVVIENDKGKRQMPDEVVLILQKNSKEVRADKQPVTIQLTKEEAKGMAIRLLKLASEPIPEHGLMIDHYGDISMSLHHAIEKGGKKVNEPVICLDDISDEDFTEEGSLSLCITNESAKAMISALAKIV